MQESLSENQSRLKAHLQTLDRYELQRLRECFEYEYTTEPENRTRIEEILNFISLVLKDKLKE